MNNTLDMQLLCQEFNNSAELNLDSYREIAASYAVTENAVSVLSDMKSHRSHIFYGGFGDILGVARRGESKIIDTIWENDILSHIFPNDMEKKQLDELQFFEFVRRNGKSDNYYMEDTISMQTVDGVMLKVLHRIFYFHEGNAVRYALCLYTPTATEHISAIVNSLTGETVSLEQIGSGQILSAREKEILKMIDEGMSSKEISTKLNISIYTVSRHRQNILEKLRAKNSSHACTRAKILRML